MFRYLLLFVTVLLGLPSARAQEVKSSRGEYIIETWNTGSMFDPFSIYSILQTPDGYLWLSTDGGLVRFDGKDFTEYNSRNTPTLTTDDVTAMAVAPDGRLWVGAGNGCIWRQEGRGMKVIRPAGEPVQNSLIYALHVAADGTIWFGDRWGISKIVNDSVVPIPLPDSLEHEVFAIAGGPGPTLWFSLGGRVARLAGKEPIIVLDPLPQSSTATCLLPGKDGELLIGATTGLFELRDGAISAVKGFDDKWVHALYRDRGGTVWIATAEDGLYRYTDGRFDHLTTADGLPNNRLRAIFEDRDGTLWFGTRGGGFFRLKTPLISVIQPSGRAGGGKVSTVYEAGDGSLLIGTRDSGLSIGLGRSSRTLTMRSGLPSDFIRCTFEDSRGDLWIGTAGAAAKVAGRSNGGWAGAAEPVLCKDNPTFSVRSIIEDSRGDIWLGSHGYGVFRYDRSAGTISNFTKSINDYYALVRVLCRRKNGEIVVGSREGLYTIGDSGAVIQKAWSMAGISEVFAVYEDADSTLWVGTYGHGLFRIRGDRIFRYSIGDGLFNNVIYAIAEDGGGRLWMSCNMGIFYANKRDLEARAAGALAEIRCISFGARDGMESVECNGGSQPSVWKSRDGKLMFATMDGVAVIDPLRLTPDTATPPVLIENMLVDGAPFATDGPIDLEPDTKKVEFDYTAIGYRRAADIEFQACLVGFDEQWADRGTRRSISYTALPHGEYVMHLRAKYPDGAWPVSWTTLAFTVRPYFWERWSVRISLAALVICGTFAFMKFRERRIKAEARREREVRSTISELESRALRSQINPHFIFNSLNGIREAVLGNRTKVASDYLEKFSALMRNVLENSDRHAVTLDREVETLRLYVELEQLRFEEPFRYVLTVDSSLDAKSIMIPPMIVQPVVENAIWHGLSTKAGEKGLTIHFSGDQVYVRCIVEDNGVGRARTAERRDRRARHRTPKGMQITRDLIEAFRTEGGGKAGIEIVDLHGGNGEPAGTRVTLTIPIQP